MDIALPIVFLFILFIPGLFFINSYYKIESIDVNFVPVSQKTAFAVVIAILLHFIAIFALIKIGCSIDVNKYINLLSNKNQPFELIELSYFTLYLLFLSILAFFMGVGVRKLITAYKLDKYLTWLRINNKWYYFFKAFDFQKEEPVLVEIFAMVKATDQCYLYRGFLEEFYLGNNGELETLILSSVSRTLTNQLKEIEKNNKITSLDDFYPIDGHYFMLKFSELINFEVFFITLSDLKNEHKS